MSRTFRRAKPKDAYLIESDVRHSWYEGWLEKSSEEFRKRKALYQSDASKYFVRYKGPSWFHNLVTQAPYRARAKNEIKRFMRSLDYDIVLESKPYTEYWL